MSPIFLLLLVSKCVVFAQVVNYNYRNLGQDWGPTCLPGGFQSPINIETQQIQVTPRYVEFRKFDIALPMRLTNNGVTVSATILGGVVPEISLDPMSPPFIFSEATFHWGRDDTRGSEHSVNGRFFSMEMQLIFIKSGLRREVAENVPGALVVLSFFIQSSPIEFAVEQLLLSPEWDKFVNGISRIRGAGSSTELGPITLSKLIPKSAPPQKSYVYTGSLNTPPCTKGVTWIVFKEIIRLSPGQISQFRTILGSDGIPVSSNSRPIQATNGRIVTSEMKSEPAFRSLVP